jgi:GH15 family glucan-1,4-alpha-glucosidase
MAISPLAIEDYALIGDCRTAALVGRNGSIDWLCWPRFDSGACFAALLGNSDTGSWRIFPAAPVTQVSRAYRDATMILETIFETATGSVAVVDFMAMGQEDSSVVRWVEGRAGTVAMNMDLVLRFDYGSSVPWVVQLADGSGISAVVGPDRVVLRAPVPLVGRDLSTHAVFTVAAGEVVAFVLTYRASHLPLPPPVDANMALATTEAHWRHWSARCRYDGTWSAEVRRSLMTLKALTFAATGGIVAAPTTSLPEQLGGGRNWDYRFCWLRDAALTLDALMQGGHYDEAQAWRDWLQRAIAGSPQQLQIMYGVGGERRLTEFELPLLAGYQGASPVRIGNGAAGQLQLDIYGEVMDAIARARAGGIRGETSAWPLQCAMLEHLEQVWQLPDEGLWEVRGGRRHFTFSKIMVWVAYDRSIRDAELYNLEAPLAHWRELRETIHATVCAEGFDAGLNAFGQSFGSKEMDASLLLIARMGFLPADDPRVIGTVAEIERQLLSGGFVLRYRTEAGIDGLPPGEGAFLACSFWLADIYSLMGRNAEAEAMFLRLLALCNDVGLLSEQYDPQARRLVGNFPQAFSHTALIATALRLDAARLVA